MDLSDVMASRELACKVANAFDSIDFIKKRKVIIIARTWVVVGEVKYKCTT